MSTYLALDRSPLPGRWLATWDDDVDLAWLHWWRGRPLPDTDVVPDPFRFTLKPLQEWAWDHGSHMPSFLNGFELPIFSDALVDALREAGVDTVDTYPAAVTDPDDGSVRTDYKVVNITALISAADMTRSTATVHGTPTGDVDFDHLVLDDEKVGGVGLFRLAESANVLLVHADVRTHLEAAGFTDLVFHDPGDIAT